MRVAGAGFVAIEEDMDQVFLLGPDRYIKVGLSKKWGGTVTYFGLAADPGSNTIDAHDTGREIQVAIYDAARNLVPCAATASCERGGPNPCPKLPYNFGWNPVQGGDRCNNGAAMEWSRHGDGLRAVARPIQWNPFWDQPHCSPVICPPGTPAVLVGLRYVFDVRFVSKHTIEIAVEIVNEESMDHPVTEQELPAFYAAMGRDGSLNLVQLLDASGVRKTGYVRRGAGEGEKEPYQDLTFMSPEPWVSLQDRGGTYGVGLAMDDGTRTFLGTEGIPNEAAPENMIHYVRPKRKFKIPPYGVTRGIFYVSLGDFAANSAELRGTLARRPPFGGVDLPPTGSIATVDGSGSLQVAGWVLDGTRIPRVHVYVDGAYITDLPVSTVREDVCQIYPNYAGCPNQVALPDGGNTESRVGFSGPVPLSGVDMACTHTLRVVAADADGNSTVLGERLIGPPPGEWAFGGMYQIEDVQCGGEAGVNSLPNPLAGRFGCPTQPYYVTDASGVAVARYFTPRLVGRVKGNNGGQCGVQQYACMGPVEAGAMYARWWRGNYQVDECGTSTVANALRDPPQAACPVETTDFVHGRIQAPGGGICRAVQHFCHGADGTGAEFGGIYQESGCDSRLNVANPARVDGAASCPPGMSKVQIGRVKEPEGSMCGARQYACVRRP